MKRKLLAVFIAMAMILTLMPTLAFAEGEGLNAPEYTATLLKNGNPVTVLDYNWDKYVEQLAFTDDVDTISVAKNDWENPKNYVKTKVESQDPGDDEYVYKNGEEVLDWYPSDFDLENNKVIIHFDNYADENRISFTQDFNINVVTIYDSITFNQTSVTIDSKAARKTDGNGRTYYDINARNSGRFFKPGDKVTVNFTGGSTKEYTYDLVSDNFIPVGGDESDSLYLSADPFLDDGEYLFKVGLNKEAILISGAGHVAALIDLYIDSSTEDAEAAAAAAAAAEAARQGTPGNLPKAKASKPKASKKAITVKWKKMTKKQLKKGVSKMEVWVCPNKAFASGATVEKMVSKKKGSVKVKGLAKGTYYVKVRAITYSGATKIVGPWSATKKVKVKK